MSIQRRRWGRSLARDTGLASSFKISSGDGPYRGRSSLRVSLSRNAGARTWKERGEKRGSLTLSVEMKGHVGGGPVSEGLWASGDRSNISRSNVLIRKHTSLYICAGTAPGDAGSAGLFHPVGSYINLRV